MRLLITTFWIYVILAGSAKAAGESSETEAVHLKPALVTKAPKKHLLRKAAKSTKQKVTDTARVAYRKVHWFCIKTEPIVKWSAEAATIIYILISKN